MNNSKYSSSSGFTLLEILVAVFVMSVGFLALSQMEYLSVRQKQMAEEGSNATSIIEYAGEIDIAELKMVSNIYLPGIFYYTGSI